MFFQITNIKISLKIDAICLSSVQEILKQKNINHTSYPNFMVIRKTYTYIIFKKGKNKNNHINITKLKTLEEIDDSIKVLKTIFEKLFLIERKKTIDNITASVNLNKFVDLLTLPKTFPNNQISYNSEKFPGLFIKFKKGTVIVFHTGKSIIIGAKSVDDVRCLASKLADI